MASRDELEIIDADDDLDAPRSQNKPKKDERTDDDLFDPLDRNIQFPEEDAENEDTDSAEDAEDTEDTDNTDDDEPVRGRRDADEDDEEDRRGGRNDQWRRRLARERRLREEAETDADHWQQEFRRVDTKIDEIAKKLDTQKSGVEIDAKIAGLTAQLAKIKTDLKAATEAGDSEKVIDLTEKLTDVKGDIKLAEYQKTQVKEAAATATATASTPAKTPPNRHLTRWMRQHGRRFNADTVFKAAATELSIQLVKEGYPSADSDHFAELDKRLSKMFPKEFPKANAKNGKRRAPISSGDEGGGPAPNREARGDGLDIKVRGNKAQLTRRHEAIMEKFGLDPDSKEDRQAFARENLAPKRSR